MASARRPTRILGPISGPRSFAEAFGVSRETLDRLEIYEDVLKRWQKAVNLVGPGTLDQVWHRHFADSAQLLWFAPKEAEAWLDLGSGAGFPGLVVAILLAEQGQGRVTLIESDRRKAAFLSEVARQTGVPVEICCERIEKTATQAKFAPVDVITARALAPLDRLLGLAWPFFGDGTVALFLKGRGIEGEIGDASRAWTFEHALQASLTEAEGRIAVIRNLHAKALPNKTED